MEAQQRLAGVWPILCQPLEEETALTSGLESSAREDSASVGSEQFVLNLRLAVGETVAGSIQRQGDLEAVPFHGWLDLMVAISMLTRRVSQSGQLL
jgi:hypothetical protein